MKYKLKNFLHYPRCPSTKKYKIYYVKLFFYSLVNACAFDLHSFGKCYVLYYINIYDISLIIPFWTHQLVSYQDVVKLHVFSPLLITKIDNSSNQIIMLNCLSNLNTYTYTRTCVRTYVYIFSVSSSSSLKGTSLTYNLYKLQYTGFMKTKIYLFFLVTKTKISSNEYKYYSYTHGKLAPCA